MVFIAQLVEHYSANAEAMGSNLVEVTVIRIWSSRAFTNTLNLFSSCTSTPKHFSLTIISWEKAIRIKERLLDVQSDHQESFSARMKSSMIGSFYQPLFGKKPAHWHFYVRWRWTLFIPIVGFSQVVKKSWSLSGIYTVRCKISTSLLRENAAQLIFL